MPVGHLVTQDAFGLQPVVFRSIAHDHKQVVRRGVAVGRAAHEFAEKKDVFGFEISVGKVSDDPCGFDRVVLQLGCIGRLVKFGSN